MTEREQNLLIVLGIVGVGVFIWYLGLPMWNEYKSWKSKIRTNVNKMSRAQAKAQVLDKLVKSLTETKRKLKSAQQKLPGEGRFNELMADLEEQALEAGIPDQNILEFNRGSTQDRELVREMIIQARFQNITMGQLIEMLWRFDHMVRMVDIKSFDNFNLQQVRTNEGFSFNLDIDLVVYILKENSSTPDSEQA